MVSKRPGEAALYLQIAEEIKKDLLKARYGEQIPSESELIEKYSVSRGTIRQAVGVLVNSGYLYKLVGKGTYRGNGMSQYDAHNRVPTFTQNILLLGDTPTITDVVLQSCKADEIIADNLSVPVGEEVWRLSRLRGVQNQKPMCYMIAYILKNKIPDLKAEDLELSLIDMITQKFKIEISSTTNSVSAMAADEILAKELRVNAGQILLVADFIARDKEERPFLYDKSYNWDRDYHYVIESEFLKN